MLLRIRSVTLLILVVVTCTVYQNAVTEAEGSSGSTWAKALPSAHAVPSESECQPYIEKAIKKLTDPTKDESVEVEQNSIDDLETVENESTIEIEEDNSGNTNDINVENESNAENKSELSNSSENNAEIHESTTEENAAKKYDDNPEKTNDAEQNKYESNKENEKFEESKNIDSDSDEVKTSNDNKEEAKVTIKNIPINESDDSQEENQIETTDENRNDNQSQEFTNENTTESDNEESKENSDNTENAPAAIDEDDEDENEITDKKFGKIKYSKKPVAAKKSKMDIAKIIKDKKLKKNIKAKEDDNNYNEEEKPTNNNVDDDSNDSKEDNKNDADEYDAPEEELTKDREIPTHLRERKHITEILQLDSVENDQKDKVKKLVDTTLKELKKLYENAIKPLEVLYKYRDLSNRHFGDAEIFSKPLILFMGPWSGGKSTIINYLLDNEYKETALRTGAEPSPAYFNILMHGENETVLDGTQLAADWTFSGLQKFGQGLLDRLKGVQMPNPLLQKINIVEIPGILEIRKQVERMFPFNDACQWFIDRADIIFLVYDPSKLDVGPETEAILDQLKGREYQTRIILNKADQVKADELMRVQGVLIWNISPLMSSIEPPIMYTTSLWSTPYEKGAPSRLLQSQEISFLKDLRSAIDRRVENKISSARRFAVRVRNHAKMVDCYLTTYYNHKSFFGNRKKVNDDIVENPQNYHIYEGLSTLTNISRYDLPDPDVYRDFFRLHPIYEFKKLSDTCTYFRGCPINKLDIAIAYDLPELVGKYKKSLEILMTSENDKRINGTTSKNNK